MNKKNIALVLAAAILGSVQLAEAQKPAKVPRVGYLIPAAGASAQYEAFRQGLRDLGYVEGQNIAIEYRSGEGSSRLADLATELTQLKVDVIVAQGAAAFSRFFPGTPAPVEVMRAAVERALRD